MDLEYKSPPWGMPRIACERREQCRRLSSLPGASSAGREEGGEKICTVAFVSVATEPVESVDEWAVKGAVDQVMEVGETETGWDQEAWGRDQDPDRAYNVAPCLSFGNRPSS